MKIIGEVFMIIVGFVMIVVLLLYCNVPPEKVKDINWWIIGGVTIYRILDYIYNQLMYK